jgi:hypothetical protein
MHGGVPASECTKSGFQGAAPLAGASGAWPPTGARRERTAVERRRHLGRGRTRTNADGDDGATAPRATCAKRCTWDADERGRTRTGMMVRPARLEHTTPESAIIAGISCAEQKMRAAENWQQCGCQMIEPGQISNPADQSGQSFLISELDSST